MTIRRKGAAPWSVDYEAGLADAPVSSHPGVEADQVIPTIDAGFIDADGSWQIATLSNDNLFTFGDETVVAAGAALDTDVNMLNHDTLIFAAIDRSGNNISSALNYRIPQTLSGPYDNGVFLADGMRNADFTVNEYPGTSGTGGIFDSILDDSSEQLVNTWTLFKIIGLKGTQGLIRITNNEGVNSGTIQVGFLRIV